MKSIIRGFFSVILSIFICLSAFVYVATAVVKFKLADVEYYVKSVITDEYVAALRGDVYENITALCVNLEVKQDTVMSFVYDSDLKRISEVNLRATFSSLMNGTPLEYERFESVDLKDEINRELEEFANEMGIVGEDITEASEITCEYIIDNINTTFAYFTQENMDLVSFVSRIPGLNFIKDSAFFVTVSVLTVLCVVKFLIMGKRRVRSCFYNVSFMLWLASTCWFAPVAVIKLQNIAMKIAIAHSSFRIYVQNLINAVIDGFFNVSLFAFIISTVLLIASIVLIIIYVARRDENTVGINQNE